MTDVDTLPEIATVLAPRGSALTPMAMITQALERNASVEVLAQLLALQERHEANLARKAFDAAIAAAKGEIPPIAKNRRVKFEGRGGSSTNYAYEDLAGIARVIDPILKKHGLSYRWRSEQEGKALRVSCILSHRDGYSEETTLTAPEDHTGNKNDIQAIGSTVSYLQRYTLKLGLGLSATENDDDGAASGGRAYITDEQADTLRDKLTATKSDVVKFLAWLKVESLSDIPASRFQDAMGRLAAKEKANADR